VKSPEPLPAIGVGSTFLLLKVDSLAQISDNPYHKYLTAQSAANIYHTLGKDRETIIANLDLLNLSDTNHDLMCA